MSRVLYPGSFDPITKGHMNIIEQASNLFDEVLVAVLCNPNKMQGMFSIDERVAIIEKLYENIQNVRVISASVAAVDVAIAYECRAIIRGLRSLSDYDYEVGMQQINKEISNGSVNTVCLFADKEYQFVSSSMVKEVFSLGKDISRYVAPDVRIWEYDTLRTACGQRPPDALCGCLRRFACNLLHLRLYGLADDLALAQGGTAGVPNAIKPTVLR